jgi:predicted enzyme related to lactoylglutathione lyase
MPNLLRHFSIGCDDVERGRAFYERVFGWHIEPWGPPDYYLIFPEVASRGVTGDLSKRRDKGAADGLHGFVCTFGVDDLQPIVAAVVANGGAIEDSEYRIEGVGNLVYIRDTEGNRVGVMRYDHAIDA